MKIVLLLLLFLVVSLIVFLLISLDPIIDAQIRRAEIDVKSLRQTVDRFHKTYQRYPTTEEGIDVLVSKGLLRKEPYDSWSRKYKYKLINRHSYKLYSLGPNGVDENGDGDDIQETKD